MKKIEFQGTYAKTHQIRFRKTLNFMKDHVALSDKILDLGPPNPLSDLLSNQGYNIHNTKENIDLDLDYEIVKDETYDIVTAFEILEHLVSPFPLLECMKAKKLFISVPLKLWFSNAYWSKNDPYDRHYHEFEPRQFDMLLNKAGWKIKQSEKWTSASGILGIRPLLRHFTPRYYFVYCERH